MVGDKKKTRQNKTKNSVELEASLAPAEAEVGALAKADQYGGWPRSSIDQYWCPPPPFPAVF